MVKIGILIDGFQVKRWHYEIVKYIEEHPELDLCVFLKNANESKFTVNSSFTYRLSQAIDRKIFSVNNDVFKEIDLNAYQDRYPVYNIYGIEKRFSYRFPSEDVEKIKGLNLDLLIRFGFGILRGEILNSARYGVWSLHHGDNDINRGGPPAFWEVANREEVTGITLQKLSENLDGGQIINKSFIKTNSTSFYRNKNEAFWAGVELFQLSLDQLSKGGINSNKISNNPLKLYSYPLYKDPDNLTSLRILAKFWKRRLWEFFEEKTTIPQWYLLYNYKQNYSMEKSLFRYKKLLPPAGYDWADPFIIKRANHFYLFFEELKIGSGRAWISFFEFDEKGILLHNVPKPILNEEHHLSYPYIFEQETNIFMLPESADSQELWLYKCEKFPDKWIKYKQIFSDKMIFDASLIYHDNIWYLFGTEKLSVGGSRDQYLNIYFTSDLNNDEWNSHPSNPISLDIRGARPAGKIFMRNGILYRPSQIGAPKYGYGIQMNEIKILTPTEYSEVKVDEVLPKWSNNLYATHTFNHYEGFTVVDAQGKI